MTLKRKFEISATSLVLIVVIGMAVSLFWSEKRQVMAQITVEQNAELKKLGNVFNESLVMSQDTLAVNYIKELLNSDSKVFYAGVVAIDGTGNPWYMKRDREGIIVVGPENSSVQRAIEAGKYRKAEVRTDKGDRFTELSMPVVADNRPLDIKGYVWVGYSWKEVSALLNNNLRQTAWQLVVVGFISVLFGFLLVEVLVAALTRPIDKLMSAALMIARGKKGVQIPEEGDDELTRLTRTFNRMSLDLIKLDELKDDFMSHVSHELRSPLTSIIATVELMKEMPLMDKDPKFKRQIDRLSFGSERLNRLVDNILDLTRMEAGKMPFDFQPNDMAKILTEMADFFEPRAMEKGLKITAIVPGNLPLAMIDAEKIRQVVSNLVHNAIKFTNSGGIILSAKEKAGFIQVSIQDTGVGIPKDKLDRVFEKFECLKDTKNRVDKPVPGSGLGLNIVRKSIETHGGEIWVESEIDKGSTFFFTVPIARDPLRAGEIVAPRISQEPDIFYPSEIKVERKGAT